MAKREAKPEPPSDGNDSDQLQDAPLNGHQRTQDLAAATQDDSQDEDGSSPPAKKRRKLPNGARQDAAGSGSDSEQEEGDETEQQQDREQEQEDSQMDVKPFFMPQRSRDVDGSVFPFFQRVVF